ncbi:hypothetical protein I6F34_00795 [Bradyrhizobium sp. BRP05]|nr:hypothetical protein [Bradyrhizobium sp. BRP05]
MPVDKRYTAEAFKKKLPRRHSRGYIAIPELRIGCGYAGGAEPIDRPVGDRPNMKHPRVSPIKRSQATRTNAAALGSYV